MSGQAFTFFALPKESKQRKGTASGGVAEHRKKKAKTPPRLRRFLTPFSSYAAESRAIVSGRHRIYWRGTHTAKIPSEGWVKRHRRGRLPTL